jgi:curved DNA-binding protein CbpA
MGDYYEGIGALDQTVRAIDGVDISGLNLSTAEGYVLTRIDGLSTSEDLCAITGIGRHATLEILRKLCTKGIVVIGEGRPAANPKVQATTISGKPIEPSPESTARVDEDTHTTADEDPPRAKPESKPGIEAELDQEEADGIDLKRDIRAQVRELHQKLASMNFFELLGVTSDADSKQIRRAYFKHSKRFHPDRYFSKNCGHYKEKLAKIFAQMTSAYEALMNDGTREKYRRMVMREQEEAKIAKAFAQEVHRAATSMGHQAIRLGTAEHKAIDGTASAAQASEKPKRSRRVRPATVEMPTILEKALESELRAFVEDSTSSNFIAVDGDDERTEADEQSVQGTPRVEPSARRDGSTFRERVRQREDRPAPRYAATESQPISEQRATGPQPIPRQHARRSQTLSGANVRRRTMDLLRRRRQATETIKPSLDQFQRAKEFFERGKRELESGKALAAAASFKLAMTYDPSVPEYVESYESAVEGARSVTAARLYKRAEVEHSVGRLEAAATLFMQAADTHDNVSYLVRATRAAVLLSDVAKAKDYASRAMKRDGASVEARVAWGEACLLSGERKRARREAEIAIKAAPDNEAARDLYQRCRGR